MSASNPGRWLAIAASVVVMASVVAAMLVMGSPESQRESRLDRKREQDMERIAMVIDARAMAGKPLPRLASRPRNRGGEFIPIPATDILTFRDQRTHRYRLVRVHPRIPRRVPKAWIPDWLHGRAGIASIAKGIAKGQGTRDGLSVAIKSSPLPWVKVRRAMGSAWGRRSIRLGWTTIAAMKHWRDMTSNVGIDIASSWPPAPRSMS